MKIYICTGSGYIEDTKEDIDINTIVRASDDMDAYKKFNSWCSSNGIEPESYDIVEKK